MKQDLRYAVRMFLRAPGFTAIAIVTLALGIGANTAIFSVVNALVLRSLPVREPSRLVAIWEKRPKQDRERNVVSAPDFIDWRAQARSFEGMAAWTGMPFNITGGADPEAVIALLASANFFDVLGVSPALGRAFRTEEEQTPESAAIISHSLWQRRFGGERSAIGKPLLINGKAVTIVGVAPREFTYPHRVIDVWLPVDFAKFSTNRGLHQLNVVARLKTGVTIEQARAEMTAISLRLEQLHPKNAAHYSNVFSLQDELVREVRPAMLVLLAAVGLVLLIACANLANLLMARAVSRQREIAIRSAIGAGRFRLIRQFLTESLLLSLFGGVAGLTLASWGAEFLGNAIPQDVMRMSAIAVDGAALAFNFAVAIATGLIFGLAPAIGAFRGGLRESLSEGWSGTESTRRQRIRNALVAFELALAVLLLAGAGLMLRTFWNLMRTDTGFAKERLLTFQIMLPGSRYRDARITQFFDDVIAKIRARPGVLGAAAVSHLPLTGQDSGRNFSIEGRPPASWQEQYNAAPRFATPGYFETMEIRLLRGRPFSSSDHAVAPKVVVINSAFARKYFPGEDPIGKRIDSGGNQWREIVGVVGDVRHTQISEDPKPEMFFPLDQFRTVFMNVVVRTAADPSAAIADVRAQVRAVDKDQPIARVQTIEEVVSESMARPRLYAVLLGAFAALALALGVVGVYGVISYAVGRRTREMGIRIALGATRRDVLGLVMRDSLMVAVPGIAVGIAAALAFTRVLGKLLYGVKPGDAATLAVVSIALLAATLLAGYVPARRATRVDPTAALRHE